MLISFDWLDQRCLCSPRIPFVTSPEEWCGAQLFDAACLTLDLLERANGVDADLKDASAWNVIFDGCKPVFCDLTSLEPMRTHAWWAAGQFVRHFISPLWLARTTGMESRDVFRMFREGAQPEFVRETLGWRRFLSRCWPLVVDGNSQSADSGQLGPAHVRTPIYRRRLITSLRWMLDSVRPLSKCSTLWSRYTSDRNHYSAIALKEKREQVAQWLVRLCPSWSLDLGCNSGEFSQLALDVGSKVIALDGDHDAVQSMYLQRRNNLALFPVLARLDDIHSGRGWGGEEHPGLMQRLQSCADVVLMLALLHHLAVSAAVSLENVAHFAAACSRRWLIVEWLAPTDSQLLQLCAQRCRNADDFSLDKQRQAFLSAGFKLQEEISLSGGHRILALLEKCN
ncbi:hypothetical protein [Propionivibrio dicarboxylicus]|nr:hypothetical protein [Propionivibrio dicarboxylicus]